MVSYFLSSWKGLKILEAGIRDRELSLNLESPCLLLPVMHVHDFHETRD